MLYENKKIRYQVKLIEYIYKAFVFHVHVFLIVIAEKLGIKISTRDLRQNDPRLQIQSIFSQWLPIERAVLEMIVRIVPRPGLMSDEKSERLMCSLSQSFNSFPEETRLLKDQFKQSNQYSDHTIVFISKVYF